MSVQSRDKCFLLFWLLEKHQVCKQLGIHIKTQQNTDNNNGVLAKQLDTNFCNICNLSYNLISVLHGKIINF